MHDSFCYSLNDGIKKSISEKKNIYFSSARYKERRVRCDIYGASKSINDVVFHLKMARIGRNMLWNRLK
jgi:hypothetical protein